MNSTPAASNRPALVVLGPEAAGAGLLARTLRAAGADAPDGATGRDLAAWTSEALAARESHWSDLFGPRAPGAAVDPAEVKALAHRLEAAGLAQGDGPLLLQDPAAGVLVATWAAALRRAGLRPVFVAPVLDPVEAAAALKSAHGFTQARGVLLWTSHMLRAERATRGERRVFVDIARLGADPDRELDRVERALGARLPRRGGDAADEVKGLLHGDAATRPPASAPLPAALAPVRTLHAHLLAAAQDAPENADVAAEVGGWFDDLEQAIAPVLEELERELRRREATPAPTVQGPDPRAEAAEREAAERGLRELDQELKAARRDLAEALDRAHAGEAQASIARASIAIARRRTAEAEELIQRRLLEAQGREREAREALAVAVARREAAEAQGAQAAAEARAALERQTERASVAETALQAAAETASRAAAAGAAQARRSAEREGQLDAQLGRVRELAEVSGVSNLAAQARVRELEARLEDAERRVARRSRWWLGPFSR